MGEYQNSSFPERLREAIKRSGKKQVDVARAIGVPECTISSYLKGRYGAKMQTVAALARFLRCDEMWLLGYDVPCDRFHGMNEEEREEQEVIDMLMDMQQKNAPSVEDERRKQDEVFYGVLDQLTDDEKQFLLIQMQTMLWARKKNDHPSEDR